MKLIFYEGNATINAKFLKDLNKVSMLLKQNVTRPLFHLHKQSNHRDISKSKNYPAILGPGLVVSPGGNVYSNRYYCKQSYNKF